MRSLPAVQHSQGSAMRPFTVGIIGCGWAGARHARAFASQPGVAVTWAIDLRAAPAQAVAKLLAGARASADYNEALDDRDLDAVDICLPHHLHARVSVKAIARGKHVLCEKPSGGDAVRGRCDDRGRGEGGRHADGG